MARTTATAVKLILQTSLTDDQIDAFIADASTWVDTFLVGACTALTDAILTAVEKYLAAHMITARDARLKSAKFDDIAEAYQRDAKVSEYLRAAIGLDPCGIVTEHWLDQEKRRPVKFRVGEGFDDDLDLPTD